MAKRIKAGDDFDHPTLGACRVTGADRAFVYFRKIEERSPAVAPVPEQEHGVYATADTLGGLNIVSRQDFAARDFSRPFAYAVAARRVIDGGA